MVIIYIVLKNLNNVKLIIPREVNSNGKVISYIL